MGSGIKQKKSYKGLNKYAKILSNEEQLHFDYCVNNNYRISPKPNTQGLYPHFWFIEIRIGLYKKKEKAHISPAIYNSKEIWPAIRKTMKYYYDKRTR